MPTNLEAALRYAALGVPVVPVFPIRGGRCACGDGDCRSPGKHPIASLAPNGIKNATADERTVRAWWTAWPDANIAAPTGPALGVVLDVDPRHGGDASLMGLVGAHGPLPPGPHVRTGGGGWHYYFAHPGGTCPIAHGFRPGLDLQGDGAYVLLPPSSHASGGTYRWAADLASSRRPMLPGWLFRLVDDRAAAPRAFPLDDRGRIPHGQHHDYIVSMAASVVSRTPGIGYEQLRGDLRFLMSRALDDAGRHERDVDDAARSAIVKFGRGPAPPPDSPSPREDTGGGVRVPAPPPQAETPTPPAPSRGDAPAPVPPGLFSTNERTGAVTPVLRTFVDWARATDRFVVPVERDTFRTGGKFDLLRYQDGYYNGMARTFLRGRVEDAHRARGVASRDAFREEVVRGVAATSEFHRRREEFNPPDLVCLTNGVLDTRTGALSPHSPDVVFTWRMPVAYDPAAGCPTFDAFLERTMPDPKRRELVIDVMGYCLWRSNGFHVFFVNVGDGANGKTTWLRVIEELLGPDAVATQSLQDLAHNRFSPAELDGRLANLCDDLPFDKEIRDTSALKMLTGEGKLKGERKGEALFGFRFDGKIIANANRTPEVRDDTYAFWRRVVVIPWQVTLVEGERDPRLVEKIRAELPGVLNLALRGLARVRARDRFDPDGVFEGSKEEWRRRADPVRAELLEDFEVARDGFVSNREFVEWHVRRSESQGREPLEMRVLARRITAAFPLSLSGTKRFHGKRLWGRSGVAFKTAGRTPAGQNDDFEADDGQTTLPEPQKGGSGDFVRPAPPTDGVDALTRGGPAGCSVPGIKTSNEEYKGSTSYPAGPPPRALPAPSGDGANGRGPDASSENSDETPAAKAGRPPLVIGPRIQFESAPDAEPTPPDEPFEARVSTATASLLDSLGRRGDIPFDWENVKGWLVARGANPEVVDAAIGGVVGRGLVRRLPDGRWQLKLAGESGDNPVV